MHISKEDTGQLSARIRVTIEEKDYLEKVEEKLREHRRKAKVPGFRPGKVPAGMIHRIYAKPILLEEVNTILSDSISHFLTENELNILGHPLAVIDDAPEIDWENQKEFEFWYDLGIAPVVKADLEALPAVTYFDIQAGDEKINEYIKDLQRRFGNRVHHEQTEEGDIVKGMFNELDSDGEAKEDGISRESSLSLEFVKDPEIRQSLIGMSIGDSLVFNPLKATGNVAEVASMLAISRDKAENLDTDFRFTLTEVSRMEPAELNEELFSRVFPKDTVNDEEAFRAAIGADINRSLSREAETLFFNDSLKVLMETEDFPLPEEFLKRWLHFNSKKELTEEEMEAQFPLYIQSMRWQILQEELLEKHGLHVGKDDIRMHIQAYFQRQFGFPGVSDDSLDPNLASIIDKVMEDKEEVERIYEQLTEDRLVGLFLSKVPQTIQSVTYEEFVSIVKESRNKQS